MTAQPRILAGLGGRESLWTTEGTYLWWTGDGDRVLVENRDLFLHDACTGALLRVFPKARFHVHGRPLSHDDERVLAGDGVWDTATMRELFPLHHPRGTTAEWNPDGTPLGLATDLGLSPPDLTSPDGTRRLVPEATALHVVTDATGYTVPSARAVIEERPLTLTGQSVAGLPRPRRLPGG